MNLLSYMLLFKKHPLLWSSLNMTFSSGCKVQTWTQATALGLETSLPGALTTFFNSSFIFIPSVFSNNCLGLDSSYFLLVSASTGFQARCPTVTWQACNLTPKTQLADHLGAPLARLDASPTSLPVFFLSLTVLTFKYVFSFHHCQSLSLEEYFYFCSSHCFSKIHCHVHH